MLVYELIGLCVYRIAGFCILSHIPGDISFIVPQTTALVLRRNKAAWDVFTSPYRAPDAGRANGCYVAVGDSFSPSVPSSLVCHCI